MNLGEIRDKFRELTGRYDLVGPNGGDEGADFFINAAQRWLDRKLDFSGGAAELSLSLSTGAYSADVGIRAVKSVGIDDGDNFDFLEREDYQSLKQHTHVAGSADNGTPRFYGIGRFAPSARTTDERHLLVWPPSDGSYSLLVEGLYQTEDLEAEDDVSWWSENFPLILVKAAAFRMEAMQRNTSGESDYRASLMEDLRGLDFDQVEQDIAGRNQRQSNWQNIDL